MGHLMPQPLKHPKTGVYWFRKTVPERLRSTVGKREIKFSLGTKDPREAKLRYPEAAARADLILQQATEGKARLTHQQVLALAADWYRRELEERSADPGDAELLFIQSGLLEDLYDENLTDHFREREEFLGDLAGSVPLQEKYKATAFLQEVRPEVDALLAREGLVIDRDSHERLSEQVFFNKMRLLNALQRRATGDYRANGFGEKLPKWDRREIQNRRGAAATLTSLLDAWATERKPPERTLYEWRRIVGRLGEHLGHEDAERITKRDLVAWKDALVASGKAAKTVKNHVDIIHALYNSALENERLERTDNPAKGVKVRARENVATRRQSYSDEDAALILKAARKEKGYRRWVPWLLAFTGARLDEVCQALAADIRQDPATGFWYLDINAEAGKKLKNVGSARKVPLHPALIREGFLDFVKSRGRGPLFPDLKPDRFGSRGGNATKVLGRWTRSLGITDRAKAPNHSWRHRFKDVCRAAGIEKSVHDALTGHASSDVGDGYGSGYELPRLAPEIERIKVPKGLLDAIEQTSGRDAPVVRSVGLRD
jgi:site-specific recombinase XerD